MRLLLLRREPTNRPALGSALGAHAQLGEDGGEHGQGADDGDEGDDDRAGRDGREDDVVGEVEGGAGDGDGETGEDDGPSGGGGGEFDDGLRAQFAVGARSLLTFALEVEERVVDADREADEQDDVGADARVGEDVRGHHRQADGRGDRGQGEQQRNEGHRHGAEDQQQGDEGDRQGDHLGAREVVAAQLLDALADGRRSGLLDAKPGVGPLDGRRLRDQRVDVLLALQLRALHGDGDPHRRVARAADRVGDGKHLGQLGHPGGDVGGGRVGRGDVELSGARLRGDQDVFDGALL